MCCIANWTILAAATVCCFPHDAGIASAASSYNVTDLGGGASEAYGINDNGWVVGFSSTTNNAAQRAFLYDGSTMTDLGTLGGGYCAGAAINDSGLVVGTSYLNGNAVHHAFLYDSSTIIDLNTLIDPSSGWTLLSASDINDAGQIVGTGRNIDGRTHAFLLTPVPEPSTLVLLGIGAVSLLAYAWRRRGS
jgi:probable HAF family extracellular repeat protein